MRHEIICNPTYSLVEVELQPGDKIVSEAGAMAWMDDNIRTETSTRGGIFGGLKRAILTKESFFQNTYTAEGGSGMVGLAPGCPGDIVYHEMNDGELFLEKGAYLASGEHIHCDSKFEGLKGFFNEGMFALRVTGTGPLFFNAYGSVQEIQVNGEYTVDNGFAVAWEPQLQWTLTRAKKIRSFLFSDQLLLRFTGHGTIWVQSRSPISLVNWVHPFRPTKSD
ncbi:MAG: TIGR00266 family protein [Planctomycetales bacterium]